jgi:hypothetical protein
MKITKGEIILIREGCLDALYESGHIKICSGKYMGRLIISPHEETSIYRVKFLKDYELKEEVKK